jgi:acetolactate synthase-1/2/3 large subunit
VIAAFRWQDAISNASPAYAGYLGLGCSPPLRALVAESDLVVAFGLRLDDPTTSGYQQSWAGQLVRLSQAEDELAQWPPADLSIHCGLEPAAVTLNRETLAERPARTAWLTALRAEQDRFSSPFRSTVQMNGPRWISRTGTSARTLPMTR